MAQASGRCALPRGARLPWCGCGGARRFRIATCCRARGAIGRVDPRRAAPHRPLAGRRREGAGARPRRRGRSARRSTAGRRMVSRAGALSSSTRARAGSSSAGRPTPTAALLDRLPSCGWPLVLTGAPDAAERALVAAIRGAIARRRSTFPGSSRCRSSRAPIGAARLFIGVDSAPMHIASGDGHAGGRAVRSERRSRMGTWRVPHRVVASTRIRAARAVTTAAAAATSDCLLTLPRSPRRGRGRAELLAETAAPAAPMRLAIVRQRYPPFGGPSASSSAPSMRSVARGVRSAASERWPLARDGRVEPVICYPFDAGSLARRELRPRGARFTRV